MSKKPVDNSKLDYPEDNPLADFAQQMIDAAARGERVFICVPRQHGRSAIAQIITDETGTLTREMLDSPRLGYK